MEFDNIYNRAVMEIRPTGIWTSNAFPPIHRGARKLGFELKPPHYNSFKTNALFSGVYLAIAWAIVYSVLIVSQGHGFLAGRVVVSSLLIGLFFGLCMASYYKFSASSNSLSTWDELSNE